MIKLPWGSWEMVGEESEYVAQITTAIQQCVPFYGEWLTDKRHFELFSEGFCAYVCFFFLLLARVVFVAKC